ncbi:acyltransferase family protein [Hymenobacter persicinus]|uniref:Acyltransferase n=1 Tax=Hymenobacter persicinus TaxID=2025506 RepID=A0A4Q5LAM6_9BACT|nr:acyltransferase [Hymenobacter persicinus]RYU79025.1 acyltransferase [Hymenobacter persicinus]
MTAARTHLPALTGVRAGAALLVFLFHYRTSLPAPAPGWAAALQAVGSELHVGVSVFFTLSGYLLSRRYFATAHAGSFGQFLLRRVARIYPLLLLLTTATFVFGHAQRALPAAQWWQQYALNLTLLKGLAARWYLTGIGPSWSLTVEESFYLLLPLLFALARRFSPRIWVGCVVGLAALGLALGSVLSGRGWLETPLFVLSATFFGRSAEFLFGAAFARLAPARVPHATALGGLVLVVVLGLMVGVQQQLGVGSSIESLPGVAANNWLLPLGTGLLLHGLANQPSWLQRALGSRPLQVLGRSSYAFYLLHLGLLPDFLLPRIIRLAPLLPPVPVLLLLLVGAAIGLHYAVEAPLHRLVLRLGAARRGPGA